MKYEVTVHEKETFSFLPASVAGITLSPSSLYENISKIIRIVLTLDIFILLEEKTRGLLSFVFKIEF